MSARRTGTDGGATRRQVAAGPRPVPMPEDAAEIYAFIEIGTRVEFHW